MQSLCDKIKSKLKCLPPKDAQLCEKYFEKRDFESILEIAKSDLIMKERDDAKATHQDKWKGIDAGDIQELIADTTEYLSGMGISCFSNEDEYYD
jgi:hypothetical protein